MSNSATNLDLIATAQAQKEATANALFDAASPAMLYGRRASTTGGLVWGYFGGMVIIAGTPTQINNGTLTLTASATNYLEANPADGTLSVNASGFTAGRTPIYQIVTNASTVTSYQDLRVGVTVGGGVSSVNGHSGVVVLSAADVGADSSGAASAAVAAHAAASDPHPQYLTQAEGDGRYLQTVPAGYLTQTAADARYLQTVPAQPFDLTGFYPGTIPASALVTRVPFARTVSFPASLTGSIGKAKTAATAQTDFDIQKNGVSVGTMRFAAASASATFIAASAFSLAAGDVLSIIAPASPDTTLADIGFVLTGTR